MAKSKKPSLPSEKFLELPDRVIRDQIKEIFKPEVRDNYSVDILIKDGDRWFIKLVLNPTPDFQYKKEYDDET